MGFRPNPILNALKDRAPVMAGFTAACIGVDINIHSHGVANPGSLLFWDSGTLTDAVECVRSGQDPYVVLGFDRLLRPFNYPPIWLQIRHLGVTSQWATGIGIFLAFLTLVGMMLLFKPKTNLGRVFAFLAAFCWPVRFAIERGNIDQAVFLVLVGGFLLGSRLSPERRAAWGGFVITVATAMKIFPIVASVALVRNRKALPRALAAFAVAGGLLGWMAGSRMARIVANTPQDTVLSYGSMPSFEWASLHFFPSLAAKMGPYQPLPTTIALVLGALSILLGAIFASKLRRFLPALDLDCARGSIAAAGLAIYGFTYLRGSNYGYRLMILTAVVAWLVERMEQQRSLDGIVPAIVLTAFLSMSANHPAVYLPLGTLVFIFSCAWLGASMFERLRVGVARPAIVGSGRAMMATASYTSFAGR